jgi:hypothetical protein
VYDIVPGRENRYLQQSEDFGEKFWRDMEGEASAQPLSFSLP